MCVCVWGGGGGGWGRGESAGKKFATMLLHFYFILFDLQHDHVLKKLN